MENRNIYKMDDFLIISSYIMIIPILVLAWPWLTTVITYESLTDFFNAAPARLENRMTAIILYAIGAVSSQIIGRIIRYTEKQSLDILDTLHFYKNTTITQLSSQLGISESKISSLVKKMSRIPSLGISIEGESVTIGQIISQPAPENFSSYNNPVAQEKTDYSSEEMLDDYVETENFDMSFKEALKNASSNKNMSDEERKEEFKKIAQSFTNTKGLNDGTGKKFNIVLFIILFITPLWPIALVYAIRYALKQNKAALTDRK